MLYIIVTISIHLYVHDSLTINEEASLQDFLAILSRKARKNVSSALHGDLQTHDSVPPVT